MSSRAAFVASQQIAPALINAAINGGIAWAMHRDTAALALWGDGGYATDLLATGLLLPGITWLIVHPLWRRQARQGKAPALAGVPVPWLTRWLPSTYWRGALVVGLFGTAIGAGVAGLMQAIGSPTFAGAQYAWFKGAYGGLLPILLQPAMLFAVLHNTGSGGAARSALGE